MNRRYLIDDVCLWCARVFAAAYLLLALYLAGLILETNGHHRFLRYDQSTGVGLMLALAVLWIGCVWKQLDRVARGFLGITSSLYLAFVLWELQHELFLNNLITVLYVLFFLMGLPSMVWISLHPVPRPRASFRLS